MRLSFSKIVLPVCLAFVCSCSNTSRNESDFKYEVVINDTLDTPSWYDLFESVSYIPLKTDVPMGQVSQIVVKDGLMYVVADGLYCFDMDGNCMFQNTNKGRARNEFLKTSSLSVCDGKVYVYDRYKYNMLVFDAGTGAYIKDFDIPTYKTYAWFNGDSYISVDADLQDADQTLFKCYSKDDVNIQTAAYFPKKDDIGVMFGTTSWANDGLICVSYLRNLAWKINGKDTIPYIKVTVPESKRLSDKITSAMISDGSRSVQNYTSADAIYGLYYVTECDGFITGYMTENENGSARHIDFIYNKRSGKTCSFRLLRDSEPWQLNPIADRDNPGCGEGNSIYIVSSPDSWAMVRAILGVGNEPTDPQYNQAYQIFKSTPRDANPVVARFNLK